METAVRRGGVQTPQGFLYELSGGHVALDFANTIDKRPAEHPRELIRSYVDLCSWSRQAGILTPQQEKDLVKKSRRNPAEAEKTRALAIQLRECMFEIFRRTADEAEIPDDLSARWNRFVRRSMQHYELVPGKDRFVWRDTSDASDLDRILWPIIHAAVQLLTSENATRIRRCAADNCDWLFLDRSKRGNRRWCDMTVCGNRAKARRFYSRKKAPASRTT